MSQVYYQRGRFVGTTESPAWDAHIALRKFIDRENAAEARDAIAYFRAVGEDFPDEASAVLTQYPWGAVSRGTELRTAFQNELLDVQGKLPAAHSAEGCAFLTPRQIVDRGRNGAGYLIKGLLQKRSHAVMYGKPGCGKTFLCLDLAYAVAQGRQWMGRRVRQGIVVYIPFEGAGGLQHRVEALVERYGDAPAFRMVDNPGYNLREKADRAALGEDIRSALGDEQPVLIVVDTLARAMKGGDENSAADMGTLNDAVAALISYTGACVLLVHHSGKDASKGARGSTALLGAVDTELEIEGSDGCGRVNATKQRDLPTGNPVGFKLASVALGEDEDGDGIFSCVVEPSVDGGRKGWRPTGQVKAAWDALVELAPDNAPAGEEGWREAFEAKAWPVDPPETKVRSQAWRRAVAALLEAGQVVRDGQGWRRPLEGGQ